MTGLRHFILSMKIGRQAFLDAQLFVLLGGEKLKLCYVRLSFDPVVIARFIPKTAIVYAARFITSATP